MKNTSGVLQIPVGQVENHPRNVRKIYDPEDISELAASIRSMGVLQALIVVPAPGSEESLDRFFVVAGNRRLLAAKEAGLFQVPCTIAFELSEREQAEMMVAENMQRKDLTPHEEGEAFQMLLDLGLDIEDVQKKTGLSRSTVKHRLEVGKLDADLVRRRLTEDKEDYMQLTLFDLQRLEQVEDIKKRDEILGKARSSENLAWLVNQAIREEKTKNVAGEVEAALAAEKCKSFDFNYAYCSDVVMSTIKRTDKDRKGFQKEIKKLVEDAKSRGAKDIRFKAYHDEVNLYWREKKVGEQAKESADDILRKEERKKDKLLADRIESVKTHIRDMAMDVVEGKLFREDVTEDEARAELLSRSFRVMIASGGYGYMLLGAAAAYHDGVHGYQGRYEVSEDEKREMEALPDAMLALLVAGSIIDSGTAYVAYGRRYEADRWKAVKMLLDALRPYGCELDPEEMRLVNGHSEAWSNPIPEEEENETNDYENTRRVRQGRRLA